MQTNPFAHEEKRFYEGALLRKMSCKLEANFSLELQNFGEAASSVRLKVC